jgi:hypothetical protein
LVEIQELGHLTVLNAGPEAIGGMQCRQELGWVENRSTR